jgi:hypothetical protein
MTTEAFPRGKAVAYILCSVPQRLRKFSAFFIVLVRKLGYRAPIPTAARLSAAIADAHCGPIRPDQLSPRSAATKD